MAIERDTKVARRSLWIPKGACIPRVSRAVNGAMVEVSGKQQHSGLGGVAWEQGLDACSFEARSPKMTIERDTKVGRGSLWIPKGACSPRVSRAVNGAMVEV